MRAALPAAALMLAGCGSEPAEVPGNAAAAAPSPAQATTPRTAIGTTSGLSAETSALTGAVSDFRVTVTDTATVVALASDTLFAFDKAELASEALANLQRTAALIREGGKGAVAVSGHTDAKGEDAYNLALSQRRAEAVAAWLRRQPGMTDRAFDVLGKGEAAPVAPNARPDGSDDPEGRARNRRVEVAIPRR